MQKVPTFLISGAFAILVTAVLVISQAVFLFWPNESILAQTNTTPGKTRIYDNSEITLPGVSSVDSDRNSDDNLQKLDAKNKAGLNS